MAVVVAKPAHFLGRKPMLSLPKLLGEPADWVHWHVHVKIVVQKNLLKYSYT